VEKVTYALQFAFTYRFSYFYGEAGRLAAERG
jgi:hypothetical protein